MLLVPRARILVRAGRAFRREKARIFVRATVAPALIKAMGPNAWEAKDFKTRIWGW